MRIPTLYSVTLTLLLAGCKTGMHSNYADLPEQAKSKVTTYKANTHAEGILQEITADDVRQMARQHAFTWVVTWAPWCKPWHEFMAHFEQHQRRLADRDIQLVLVDVLYSPSTALGRNDSLRGYRPAYVVNWHHYGRDADVKFRQGLAGRRRLPDTLRYAAHFVLNQQQQLVLISRAVDLPFEELERATAPAGAGK